MLSKAETAQSHEEASDPVHFSIPVHYMSLNMLQSLKASVRYQMMTSIRAASTDTLQRLLLARAARSHVALQRRTFKGPTVALRGLLVISLGFLYGLLNTRYVADIVQDLYLRELKSYKPPSIKPSDSEGHVQKFLPPKAPQSPEEGDIANDLRVYESQKVDVEDQASGGENVAYEDEGWWEELEGEEEKPAAH